MDLEAPRLSRADIQDLRKNRQREINRAVRRGKLDLLMLVKSTRSVVLQTVGPYLENSVHLVEVVPEDRFSWQGNRSEHPWELAVDANQLTLEQVGHALVPFIERYYPWAAGLPINLYGSRKEFQQDEAACRVATTGSQTTVEISQELHQTPLLFPLGSK